MSDSEVEGNPENSDSSEKSSEPEEPKRRRTNRSVYKSKPTFETKEKNSSTIKKNVSEKKRKPLHRRDDTGDDESNDEKSESTGSTNFVIGSFLISKKDAEVGDPSKHPWIWRIDGKSLLQRYESFEDKGKIRHKDTSIYTGWTPVDMDEYAPVDVDLIEETNEQVIVEVHWDELKKVLQEESD